MIVDPRTDENVLAISCERRLSADYTAGVLVNRLRDRIQDDERRLKSERPPVASSGPTPPAPLKVGATGEWTTNMSGVVASLVLTDQSKMRIALKGISRFGGSTFDMKLQGEEWTGSSRSSECSDGIDLRLVQAGADTFRGSIDCVGKQQIGFVLTKSR